MMPWDEKASSDSYTIGRVAQILGVTTENIRALERRNRLPEGCEPQLDEMTGTRYWTREQVDRLKEWNDQRVKREEPREIVEPGEE